MSPNDAEINVVESAYYNDQKEEQGFTPPDEQVVLKATRSLTTLFTHILIGIVVGASILYALRNGAPMNATNQHIILCVVGYQLLMGEAVLALAPDSWLSTLKLKHKRLIHWLMQIVGSLLALVGCFIKIYDKEVHWNSLHGQFALVSMVFTTVSLVNGLTSLYAYELRRFIPASLSKLTHICFGIVGFGAASISLAYAFDKNGFRTWISTRLADTLIIFTGILTVVIIINPFITFYKKFRGAVKI